MVDDFPGLPIGDWRQLDDWLEANGAEERQLWVSIYKKSSRKQTVTYEQLLEVGLCHGWIDVQTKSVDDERYAIRFVPRRPKSNWANSNRALARRLIAEGRMRPAGMAKLPADL
jgi:uncharacterized protein YdeI (YjbR/CyaY-like superfamily)